THSHACSTVPTSLVITGAQGGTMRFKLGAESVGGRTLISRRGVLAAAGAAAVAGVPRWAGAASADQLTWGVHVSLAPTWFEPAEASGIITPFMVLYALHDAMVKPMPDKALAPSLAESVSMAEDGRSYDFVLREGAKFHNGDPVTA